MLMTKSFYTITLDDSECMAVEASLRAMIEKCTHRIEQGEVTPYFAWKSHCLAVLNKLERVTPLQTGAYYSPDAD